MGPGVALGLDILFSLLTHGAELYAAIQKARSEGRDLTSTDLQPFVDADDAARLAQLAAIERRKASE